MKTTDEKPRKVIVGTSMYAMYGEFPGLNIRLGELGDIIDMMVAKAKERYPRQNLDLAILPEDAVCGGCKGSAAEHSVFLEGTVLDKMGEKAREHRIYLVLPMFLVEDKKKGIFSNAAILLDRKGTLAGIYRKVHPVLGQNDNLLEGGVTPGRDFPLFNCDFGKVGIQICFDMTYDDGWKSLASKGAEIVAWPTQSPQTAKPAFRALQASYYIISSTWRNNASIFEPTGMILSQIGEPERVLVQEIDLSYVLLPWSAKLRNGAIFTERFGDRVGYRYYESEDCGVFWSNDEDMTIGQMIQELGLEEIDEFVERNRRAQDAARKGVSRRISIS